MPALFVADLNAKQQELLAKWSVQDFPVTDLEKDALILSARKMAPKERKQYDRK